MFHAYIAYIRGRDFYTRRVRESTESANFAKKRKVTDSVVSCGGLLWNTSVTKTNRLIG